jgi:hypothetical protein
MRVPKPVWPMGPNPRETRMTAAEMRVSAIAALWTGFLSSAVLTASGKVSGVPVCQPAASTAWQRVPRNRTPCANAFLEYRDEWLLRVARIGMCETPNIGAISFLVLSPLDRGRQNSRDYISRVTTLVTMSVAAHTISRLSHDLRRTARPSLL